MLFLPPNTLNFGYMNDDKHLRSVKELDKAGCKGYSISRYLLRTLYDQLYQENDNLWCVSIGETVEHIIIKPRISKYEIKNIILGGGQDLLSPERRFDAVLVNSPDIFD